MKGYRKISGDKSMTNFRSRKQGEPLLRIRNVLFFVFKFITIGLIQICLLVLLPPCQQWCRKWGSICRVEINAFFEYGKKVTHADGRVKRD